MYPLFGWYGISYVLRDSSVVDIRYAESDNTRHAHGGSKHLARQRYWLRLQGGEEAVGTTQIVNNQGKIRWLRESERVRGEREGRQNVSPVSVNVFKSKRQPNPNEYKSWSYVACVVWWSWFQSLDQIVNTSSEGMNNNCHYITY